MTNNGHLPADRHIENLFDRIATYQAAETCAALKAAIARVRRARSNTPDGYPATTLGGAAGGSLSGTDADVTLTSVEGAAAARIAGTTTDPLNTQIRRCLAHLQAAVTALDLLTHSTKSIYNVTIDAELLNARKCWAMARVNAVEPFYRRVTIGDTAYDLGRFAYEYHRDTGQLPSIDQCRAKALGRRVMHKADGAA